MAIGVQGNQRSHNCGLLTIAFASASAVLLSVYLAIIGGIPWYQSREDCIVDLASYGKDDSAKYCYVRTSGGSSDEVLVLDQQGNPPYVQRGLTLVELDIAKCTTGNRQYFDVHANHDERAQLLGSLAMKTTGTVIVGVTADTAENEDNASVRGKVGPFFLRHGMDITALKFRGKLAFIMQIGNPLKTVFQIKPRFGESLRMKIAVRGSTADDVTFRQV